MKKIIVASLLGIILLVTGVYFILTNQPDQKLVIDGKEYSKNAIIDDFIDAAFSDSTLMEDSTKRRINASDQKWDSIKKNELWLFENLNFSSQFPKTNVINKWSIPVTIGFGTPNVDTNTYVDRYKEQNKAINEITDRLIPIFSKISGLSIKRIDEKKEIDEYGEDRKKYARLRIFLTSQVKIRIPNFFGGWNTKEPYFYNGVLFERSDIVRNRSLSRLDMYAYILQSIDSEVTMAICHIENKDQTKFQIELSVTECLLRSLGLPGIIRHKNLANKKDIFFLSSPVEQADMIANIDSDKPVPAPSDYEQFLLSILYCGAIKPGMNKWQVKRILKKSNECFNVKEGMNNDLGE